MSRVKEELASDFAMREMSKMAITYATSQCAEFARQFAKGLPESITGAEALEAFADAIEATNSLTLGTGEGRQ